jgi:hypothetical protein
VKAADILDSFKFYAAVDNKDQLEHHCVRNAYLIFAHKPPDFVDPIFDELKGWRDRFATNEN